MVSCRAPEADAKPNIVTVAWVGTVNSEPPMMSISVRGNRFSYDLIAKSGEFVVNLVDEAHCKALDFCGVRSGRDVDKWQECHLAHARAEHGLCPKDCRMPGVSSRNSPHVPPEY